MARQGGHEGAPSLLLRRRVCSFQPLSFFRLLLYIRGRILWQDYGADLVIIEIVHVSVIEVDNPFAS